MSAKQRVVEGANYHRSSRRAISWTAGNQNARYMAWVCWERKETARLGSVPVTRQRKLEGAKGSDKRKRKMGKFCHGLCLRTRRVLLIR